MSENVNAPADEKSSLDLQDILKILPHRYPFLLIDRITEMVRTKRIVALKNVTVNEPFFQGHFPTFPIMPGVLVVEAMAQAGGVLLLTEFPDREQKLLLFTGIDKAKFRRPVVPGDTLEYHMTKIRRRGNMWWFRGEAKVAGQVVAEAELGALLVDE